MEKIIYTFDPDTYELDKVLGYSQEECDKQVANTDGNVVNKVVIRNNAELECFIEKVGESLSGCHIRCFDASPHKKRAN